MTDTENLPALPVGWCWTTIGEISEVKGGKRLPKGHDYSETPTDFPYIRVTDFENMSVNIESLKFLNTSTQKHISNYTISKNDIYISIAGSIGKVGLIPEKLDGSNLTENAAKITEIKSVDRKFLCYILTSIASQEQIKKFTISSNQPKLALFRIKQINIPLPPLPEQHRIVQKIEELFTDLDAGVQELEKAKVQIKNYRKAVLESAVEGRLVPQVINVKNNARHVEDKLLLEKNNEEVMKSLQLLGECKISSDLPIGWQVKQLGDIIIEFQNGISKRISDEGKPIPVIRLADIKNNRLTEDSLREIKLTEKEIEKYQLKEGDILVIRVNGSENLVGRFIPCLIQRNWAYSDHLIRVRIDKQIINPVYLSLFTQTFNARFYLVDRSVTTAGQKTINQTALASLPVLVPPLEEQHQIVSEIERRFSVIDQIEKTIDQSLVQAEKLRQSILKKAFEGKLVPQDPNDEPASVLLERIKQEKGRAETRKKPEKKTKMKAETTMEISGKTKQTELF